MEWSLDKENSHCSLPGGSLETLEGIPLNPCKFFMCTFSFLCEQITEKITLCSIAELL
jgi:hypothetical protein